MAGRLCRPVRSLRVRWLPYQGFCPRRAKVKTLTSPSGAKTHNVTRRRVRATLWALHAELGGRGVDELTMRARPVDAFRPLRIRRWCPTVAWQREGQVASPLSSRGRPAYGRIARSP